MEGERIMKKIRIQNVRSLQDTGMVPMAGITLLVGENNSGKSTFLRMFPLIRQSISKRTDGPLLWAGDVDDYVDFGSFSETVTNDGANSITLHFAFEFPHINPFIVIRYFDAPWQVRSKMANSDDKPDKIIYSITIRDRNQSSGPEKRSGREYVSELQVTVNKTTFGFVLDTLPLRGSVTVDGVEVLGRDSGKFAGPHRAIIDRSRQRIFGLTLPSISGLNHKLVECLWQDILKQEDINEQDDDEYLPYSTLFSIRAIMQYVGAILCMDKTWDDAVQMMQNDMQRNRRDILKSQLISKLINKLQTIDEPERNNMLRKFKLLYFYEIYSWIDEYLDSYFRQVHYIAPLRATAERYYRQRNLAIDEVDYQGKNLPVFLNGLDSIRLENFQQWTREFFGFKVLVEKDGGHLSVKIATVTEKGVNLSDTGFGYSQILPIITQLWDLSTRPRVQNTSAPLVVAIEQPELHLHPGLQAKLAKAFIASIQLAKENNYQLQLLLETHSETIVNYFGQAIKKNKIKKEDVSILLFDKPIHARTAEVRISGYDKNGYLTNWPMGFFAPKE